MHHSPLYRPSKQITLFSCMEAGCMLGAACCLPGCTAVQQCSCNTQGDCWQHLHQTAEQLAVFGRSRCSSNLRSGVHQLCTQSSGQGEWAEPQLW
jgi:hypothetical protein